MSASRDIRSSPLHILWHYANGYMPDFLNKKDGRVGWVRWGHRGVHRTDHITFHKRQERYIFADKFEVRVNSAFEQVLRQCADPAHHAGRSWIVPELIEGLLQLHRMGHAHSWETWMDGKLVAGVWGVQIGGYINMASMFHTVSHSAKAALGRGLLMLKDRGFEWVDRGMVPNHTVDYGVEWWPRWKYEHDLARVIKQQRTVTADTTPAPLPWQLRLGVPLVRAVRAVRQRIWGEANIDEPKVPPPQQDKNIDSAPEAQESPTEPPASASSANIPLSKSA